MKLNSERLAERIFNKRVQWCINNNIILPDEAKRFLVAECLCTAEAVAEEILEVVTTMRAGPYKIEEDKP